MEVFKVLRDDMCYVLLNLTAENINELKNDSQKLNTYLNECIQTGRNICIDSEAISLQTAKMHYTNQPSTSTSSIARSREEQHSPIDSVDSNRKNSKFNFLCRSIEKEKFIFAVKFAVHPWHYFEDLDSMISQHDSLPAGMLASISRMDKMKSVTVNLTETQARNYFENGKFIFKHKELKTFPEIVEKHGYKTSESKSSDKTTKRLLFISGQSNPLIFLKDFEHCRDVKSEKDKMYKILDFIDECHKGQFTELYFTGDWLTVKSSFLKLYTLPFVENKRRELNIDFDESETLRSFFERKLSSLSKFTTLPFLNQVEIVMNDLPAEVSSLLITEGKMTGTKNEILDFCDTIEGLIKHVCKPIEQRPNAEHQEPNQQSDDFQMEIFDFDPEAEAETSEVDTLLVQSPHSSSSSGHRASGTTRKRGRPRKNNPSTNIRKISSVENQSKKLKPITEFDEEGDFNFLDEMSNSSQSTWSGIN